MVHAEYGNRFSFQILQTVLDGAADFDVSIQKKAADSVKPSCPVIGAGTEIFGRNENNEEDACENKDCLLYTSAHRAYDV